MSIFKEIVVTILTWEARLVLARHKPRVIAITGSVGKTGAKDAIYATLSNSVHVRKSEKSYNSELGVSLTILGLHSGWKNPFKWMVNIAKGFSLVFLKRVYPEWLIIEIGADRPGDIRRIARWLKADVVVLTSAPEIPAHVEYFSSPEELLKEKHSLVLSLKPGGTLVLNGDDVQMRTVHSEFHAHSVTFGFEAGNNFAATHSEIMYENGSPAGVRFRMDNDGSSVPVALAGALGNPRIYAALAALAVGKVIGLDFVSVSRSISAWAPTPGRLHILKGLKDSVIIDDTYNSSPAACLAALYTLKEVRGSKRKIAVLGDMLELGKWSTDAHRKVGERAAECADMLITIGFRARAIAEAAIDAGIPESNVRRYEQSEIKSVGKELGLVLRKNDIVLVKGSQNMRMERIVEEVMAEPERAHELLVRQDEEWLKR